MARMTFTMSIIAIVPAIVATSPLQLPARDPKAAERGTAIVRGDVVDAQSGEPIPRALVSVGGLPGQGVAQTDGEGRFEIRDLKAGAYTLTASRPPYLTGTYGQRAPNAPGSSIELRNGEVTEKIRVALSRGGVISGQVLDEYGRPAVNVAVQVLQYRYGNGRRELLPAMASLSMTRTNDLGEYRLYGLQPGPYYVRAEASSFPGPTPAIAVTAGAIPTYFPGTVDPAAAQRLMVSAGKDTSGVNIALQSGRLARLRGRAIMSSGEPFVGSYVNIEHRDGGGSSSRSGGVVRGDGSFEVMGVAPGQYVLSVRPPNVRDNRDTEVGRVRLTVTGEDIDDLLLVGTRGATLRGVIVTDESVPVPFKPIELRLQVLPSPDERGMFQGDSAIADDYTFEVKGLFGRGRISVFSMAMPGAQSPQTQWAMKTVLWRGEDVSERYLDFEPNAVIDGLQIVYSRKWSTLSGAIHDDRGRPVSDATVLIFPSDSDRWTGDSRAIRLTRAAPDGTYRLARLAGGDYFISVVFNLEPGQHQDPEWLRTVADRATRVSLGDGETKTLDVRISSAQR